MEMQGTRKTILTGTLARFGKLLFGEEKFQKITVVNTMVTNSQFQQYHLNEVTQQLQTSYHLKCKWKRSYRQAFTTRMLTDPTIMIAQETPQA